MHRINGSHSPFEYLESIFVRRQFSRLLRHLLKQSLLIHCLYRVPQKVVLLVTFQFDEGYLARSLGMSSVIGILHGFHTGLLVPDGISCSFIGKILCLHCR